MTSISCSYCSMHKHLTGDNIMWVLLNNNNFFTQVRWTALATTPGMCWTTKRQKLDSVVPVPIKVAHLWRDVADRSKMDLLPQMHTVAERNREKDGVHHIQARE